MKKKIGKITSFIMVMSVVMSILIGCADQYTVTEKQEAPQVNAVSYDIIGGDDVMPVGGFWGPFTSDPNLANSPEKIPYLSGKLPNFVTDEYYKLIKASGINTLYATSKYWGAPEVKQSLDLAGENGMAYFMLSSTMSDWAYAEDPSVTKEAMQEALSGFIEHPACAGVYLIDEPYAYQFDAIKKVFDVFYKELNYTDKHLAVTLVGHTASDRWGGYNFERELDAFIEKADPRFVAFDNYIFKDDGVNTRQYFQVLSTLYNKLKTENLPLWSFIQAGGQWNDGSTDREDMENYPSRGEFLWNFNTLLAYGSKGILVFPMIQSINYSFAPNNTFNFTRCGLLGADGSLNDWYFYLQEATQQLSAVDHILMHAKNEQILAAGFDAGKATALLPEAKDEGGYRELESVDGDALVGCFNYEGGTALYVVNYSMEENQKITLNFTGNYGYDVTQKGEQRFESGKKLTLSADAGEGIMVVLR